MGGADFILLTALLILGTGDLGVQGRKLACPNEWEALHRSCYKFADQPASTWANAKRDCETSGAQLLSIGPIAERNAIRKKLRTEYPNLTWWVGLRKNGSGWQWLDGSDLNFRMTRWMTGEPNDQGDTGENCVEMNKEVQLNDKECDGFRPYICEKRPEAEDSSFEVDGNERRGSSHNRHNHTSSEEGDDDDDDDHNNNNNKGNGKKKGGKGKHGKKKDDDDNDDDDDLYELYAGCYMKEYRKGKKKGQQAPFLYTPGASTCPPVRARRTLWPLTSKGVVVSRPCVRRSESNMTFFCGGDPTCWRGEPNVDQCAAKRFRRLLKQFSGEGDLGVILDPEETVAAASELANVTKGDDVTEDDIAVTSKLMGALAKQGAAGKIRDKAKVKRFVDSVVKAGSNLVSRNKTRVWRGMGRRDKVRSATSLLVAMDKATVAMAEKLAEPTTIVTKDDNIELELRVMDVSPSAQAREEKQKEVLYTADHSDIKFAIPLKTLTQLSSGGLAKMVFMTHYTMGGILDDASDGDVRGGDDVTDDDDSKDNLEGKKNAGEDHQMTSSGEEEFDHSSPRLASLVVSATVASGDNASNKLPEPVTFTITHTKKIPPGFESLCSFWSISSSGLGAWSQDGCRKVSSNATHTQCQCDHMTNFAVLMSVQKVEISETHKSTLRVVTIVGCVISCLCLLAAWITFTCFSSLQGERNSIHKHLVVCLFVAEVLFLCGIHQTANRAVCGVVAGFLHYFFLATFMWMLMEAVHIMLMLVQVFDASKSRMPYFYAAAYAVPLLIVAIAAGVYSGGYGTSEYCWLTTERGFIWSFAGPVAIILFVNSVVLIYAMTMVCRHSDYVFSTKDKSSAGSIRSWIQGAMALEVLLGLTWIIGFFFLSQQSVAMAYLFTILNSTQGLFIFLFHCLLNKKARKEYRRVLKMRRQQGSTGTGTGSGTGSGTQSASLARNKLTKGPSFNKHNASSQDTAPTSV